MDSQGKSSQPMPPSPDRHWPFWFTLPLYPYGQRRTLRTEIVPDSLWIFDQLQGVLSVVTPIRMTVVKLKRGGLLVYAPIAPTAECVRLMQELVSLHGAVKYIILPTVSGLEHKVFVGPFARKFAQAQVLVAPQPWSFPVNLPLSWLGFPIGRTKILPDAHTDLPWVRELAEEFEWASLGPIELGLGRFGEVAFYHQRSQSLLVTDTVVSIPATPPEIIQLDPHPLLYHARDSAIAPIEDTPTNRIKGWQRVTLFAVYFRPSSLDILPPFAAWQAARQAPDRSRKNYFGLFPYQWQPDWQQSFDLLQGQGRLLVAPILQTLILNRDPEGTRNWVKTVASWDFQRVISCHFAAPVTANAQAFRQAFAFLFPGGAIGADQAPFLPNPDFALLKTLNQTLTDRRIIPPPTADQLSDRL